jgi:hypothetical protein
VSYRDGINYLKSKTNVLELHNRFGGRVAVCPDWNGRVMTSTCDGADGSSFGLININAVENDSRGGFHFFCGGEDQLTFVPDCGPFNIHYTVELSEKDVPILVPAGFREGAFQTDSLPQDNELRLRRSVQMTNLAGTPFDLDIVRTIRILDLNSIRSAFGNAVAVSLEQADVSYIGFTTANSMLNCGTASSLLSGLVSMRIQAMFNAGPATVAVIPFQPGGDDELGPAVQTEFFGSSPHGRFRSLPSAVLLRCDGKHRCQASVFPKRAVPYIGAVDFREGTLTLLTFALPKNEAASYYRGSNYGGVSSYTVPEFSDARRHFLGQSAGTPAVRELSAPSFSRTAAPLDDEGEVLRAYNHGPSFPGEDEYALFYEFDVFSPTKELVKGESQTHHQYTLHINADNRTLSFLVQKIFGADYDEIYTKMLK